MATNEEILDNVPKCDKCGKEIGEHIYYWQGLSPEYCCASCAAWGCPNAILHRKTNKVKTDGNE